MPEVRLFTSSRCGWAVRNYAAMLEKNVEFLPVPAVDAAGIKTSEFLARSPFGTTPVLVHGKTSVFESTLINEYIDDRFPDPPLLPADPPARIEARKWIHFCESRLLPVLTKVAKSATSSARYAAAAEFDADIAWFDRSVLGNHWQGPYLFGDRFSLTDITFFTVFLTVEQVEEMLGSTFRTFRPAMRAWSHNIAERPSIREAVRIQERIPF